MIAMSELYDFYIKTGNTGPDLEIQFQDEDGDPVSIVGYSSLTFSMRIKRAGTVIIDDEDAVLVTAVSGNVKYVWSASDTVTAGDYEGEFKCTLGSGQIISFPNNGYILILISESV